MIQPALLSLFSPPLSYLSDQIRHFPIFQGCIVVYCSICPSKLWCNTPNNLGRKLFQGDVEDASLCKRQESRDIRFISTLWVLLETVHLRVPRAPGATGSPGSRTVRILRSIKISCNPWIFLIALQKPTNSAGSSGLCTSSAVPWCEHLISPFKQELLWNESTLECSRARQSGWFPTSQLAWCHVSPK